MLAAAVGTSAARADTPAQKLLDRGREQFSSAQTLQADMVVVFEGGDSTVARVRLMKPNAFRIEMKVGEENLRILSDGKSAHLLMLNARRYAVLPAPVPPRVVPEAISNYPIVEAFFAPELLRPLLPPSPLGNLGLATAAGHQQYRGVELAAEEQNNAYRWYFNEKGLPAGTVFREGLIKSLWYQNVRVGVPMKQREFEYQVPPGFTALERAAESG